MRVLQLIKTSVGATWALSQVRELAKIGIDVHMAIPAGGQLVDQYRAANASVHLLQTDFPVKHPWKYPSLARSVRRLVDNVSPDIIHSHFVGTTLTMRLALGKKHPIPRVFQVAGPLHLEHSFFANAELWTAGPADRWIASCNWTRQAYLRRGISEERVFLSYYGLDVETFSGSTPGRLRSILGVDSTRPLVGIVAYMYAPKWYLGQVRGLKGHEDFIDAISICCQKRKDILAVVIGGAWGNAVHYENRLREYGQKRLGDRIRFLGTRSDVHELYPDLNVAVHPSCSENIGGARESLLLGIPTIASSVGGFPDIVTPNETGWLTPPRSPERVADAILEALADPSKANAMSQIGQQRTRRLFDIRTTAEEVRGIYQSILSGQECQDEVVSAAAYRNRNG